MEPIEWTFTTLSFVSFYFFISKKASEASYRMVGLILSILISILVSIFSFSIGVVSLGSTNAFYTILTAYGINNCLKEIKSKRQAESSRATTPKTDNGELN